MKWKVMAQEWRETAEEMATMAVAFTQILEMLSEEELIRLRHRARKRSLEQTVRYLEIAISYRQEDNAK